MPKYLFIAAGNKCDLQSERAVKGTEAALFAGRNNMIYMETSSVEDTNVEMAYITLVSIIIREHKLKCAKNQTGDVMSSNASIKKV